MRKSMRYSTVALAWNPTRPATGVHANPVPEKLSVMVWRDSSTVCWQLLGNSRPTIGSLAARRKGTPIERTLGQTFCAPKLANSHHRRLGLSLTVLRNHAHAAV